MGSEIWRFNHLLSHHCRETEDSVILLGEALSPVYTGMVGIGGKEQMEESYIPLWHGPRVFCQTGKHLGCRLEKIIILATLP